MSSRSSKNSSAMFRTLLTETLPQEVPPNFGNQGLASFLESIGFRSEEDEFLAEVQSEIDVVLFRILCSREVNTQQNPDGSINLKVSINELQKPSIPITFGIRKGSQETRELAISHPLNQLLIADLYAKYGQRLLQHTNLSHFSIRRPIGIAKPNFRRTSYFQNESAALQEETEIHGTVLANNSYFSYKEFVYLYRFYKSQIFREQELEFNFLLKLDIQNFFNSIYTHSIEWAIYEKQNVKNSLSNRNGKRFGAVLDQIAQRSNDNETHGILIGSEFSRLFAEIILQRVDVEVERQLLKIELKRGRDFQIFRYVDDFYVFTKKRENEDVIARIIREQLLPYRLHLNPSKQKSFVLPYISEISIFNRWLDGALQSLYGLEIGVASTDKYQSFLQNLIDDYKTQLYLLDLSPVDVANTVIISVEDKIKSLGEALVGEEDLEPSILLSHHFKAINELVDFCFYVVSGVPNALPIFKLAQCCGLARRIICKLKLSFEEELTFESQVFHRTIQLMNKYPLHKNAPMETLYLLNILSEQKSDFTLSEMQLISFAGFKKQEDKVEIPEWANVLLILQLLDYLVTTESNDRALLEAIETWSLNRINYLRNARGTFAEEPILTLSILSCPLISFEIKAEIFEVYGEERPVETELNTSAIFGFMNWGVNDAYERGLQKPLYELY